MHLRTPNKQAVNLQRCLALCLCSMALACETDEPLDHDEMMVGAAGGAHADAATTSGQDAGASTPGTAGGGSNGGGNTASAGGGNAGGSSSGTGSAGGGNTGTGSAGGGNVRGADASSGTSNLDAGASTGNRDAGTGGVMIGPSRRLDGGPARWDPDAAGPILNQKAHDACMALMQNICTHQTDCEMTLFGLTDSRRAQVLESCENSFLRAHNCNRATATASGFAACSEGTKSIECVTVFATEFGSSCEDQITFQP